MEVEIIRNEKQFAEWFKFNYKDFGFTKIVRGDIGVCPDFIMEREECEVRVELETFASNFLLHKHSLEDVDEIICLIGDVELGKPVIVAENVKHKIPITVSFKIDEDLLKDAKIEAIKNDSTLSKYIEKLIRGDLK